MSGSEVGLRALLENIAQAIWETDAAGVVVVDSPSWRAYTGQSVEQWLGYGWLDAIHIEDRPHAEQQWREAVAACRHVDAEFRLRAPDGGWRWTNVRAVPLLGDDGMVRKWVGVNIDIDARKQAERALRESEERLRAFGEASSDVLWSRDAETLQWDYLTPAFETIYGVERCKAMSGDNLLSWAELIVPEDREHAVSSIRKVALGHRVTFQYRIRRPSDQQIRWLQDTDFPIYDAYGRLRSIGGVGQDVTEIKNIEATLRASEARLHTLVEGMPQLVWRAVGEGRWTWAATQWTERTGQSDGASHGLGWLEPVHPDDRSVVMAAWREAEAKGRFQVDARIHDVKSGTYNWFQNHGKPIHRADGTVAEWLGTSTDIDAQVRAREFLIGAGQEMERHVAERTIELQQALDKLHQEILEHDQSEERLRQSEKLKAVGQMTGGIAHDFNNMLQGITSALALIRIRSAQDRLEAAKTYIDMAERAAERAGALTHRLLAFSRQQTLAPEAVNLNEIAQSMEDMVQRTVGAAVQVELKMGNGHWLVLCDPNQMESALLNLCINARDAMPKGGWLTISTEERILSAQDVAAFEDLQPGRYAALAVTDNGEGMTPEVAARIFEPFFTTKPLGQGTGLGLSQIYGFMRQSGGLVQIETETGKGTTVRLCLPFHAMNPDEWAQAARNGKTLLLVEDEHDVRRLVADELRDLGYSVLQADTAAAALRVFHTGAQIDLLITDVGLKGGMNGRQLSEAVREQIPHLPVIFITGFAGEEMLGRETVIRKPFKTPALVELLRKQLP